MSETKNELAERSLLAGSNVTCCKDGHVCSDAPPSPEDEQKRIRIDGLLNRKRKSATTDSISQGHQASTTSRLKEEEIGEEGKDEETREKKEKAKQKLLWEAKRGKERAERVGPQGCKMMSAPHGLSKPEVGRYSRQLLISEFGVHGQERLLSSRVLIVGAGGLGCPCATYLAASGLGYIGIVDFDNVSLDNLHRQVAHKERNVGRRKTESLQEALLEINSAIRVICHNETLNRHNALQIIGGYDVIADCSDNPATRYLINDACVLMKKPLVSGSALRWEGQLTVYNYGEKCPCYRCIFPVPPSPNLVTNCAEGGVFGPVVGMIGSLQALEVIKVAAKVGTTYAGRLVLFDGQAGRTSTVTLRERSPKCAICGQYPTVTELVDYEVFCGSGVHDKVQEQHVLEPGERVGVAEYALLRKSRGILTEFDDDLSEPPRRQPPNPGEKEAELAEDFFEGSERIRLLDTRPPHEYAIAHLPEAINIPLERIKMMKAEELLGVLKMKNLEESRQNGHQKDLENGAHKELFVICHRGNDSQLAVRLLQERLASSGLLIRDIAGGYQAWADIVDPAFPEY